MTGFLRFLGILNAAVWCGSAIFLVVALPALFTPGMKHLLTDAGVGYAAEAIFSRFFILQYFCGAIALIHLVLDSVYYGRPVRKSNLIVLLSVTFIGLLGGLWVQPRMRALHVIKYFGNTAEKQAQAARAFAVWHGASECVNVLVIGALIWYLWRVSCEKNHERFASLSKIRG